MVTRCFICKKYDDKDCNRSFHRFPRNPKIMKLWLSALGFDKSTVIRTHARICSDHFSPQDFMTKSSGVKYLHSSAVPVITSASKSGKSTITFMLRNPSALPTCNGSNKDNGGVVSNMAVSTPSMPAEEFNQTKRELTPRSSVDYPSTLSPSAHALGSSGLIMEIGRESKVEITSQPQKKKKFFNPRYFGDCYASDMSCPTGTNRDWKIAEETIIRQRKKIKVLLQSQRRLKSKIASLSSLLYYLRRTEQL